MKAIGLIVVFVLVQNACARVGAGLQQGTSSGNGNGNGNGNSNGNGNGNKPVQIGDGSARVLDRRYMQQRGGAEAALGQANLQQLKQASRFSGSEQELAHHIDDEEDLGVDAVNVALLYQCAGMTATASAAEIASSVGPSAADPVVTTAAQAFNLSSRPGASKIIFLDFDGHNTTGTNWNSLAGIDPIVTPAYQGSLSDIVAIWRAVAEDYSMWDVDVTTADPGAAALTGNGIRVAIGGSYSDWYNSPAGGVAYVGSFGMANTPAFVFPQNLGPNYAKFVWEAVSHEIGHTLGLYHDGTTSGAAYYSGQGDWAPIMGSGYYKPVTQFDKGEFTGSNNQQDDIAVISTFLPLLPQGNGNNMATATPLNSTVDATTGIATAKGSGVVSSAGGDWFMLQAAAGTATLSAAVTAPWGGSSNRANLDIQLVVYDSAGTALVTVNPTGADPTTGLGVPATAVTLPVNGSYYIAVMGAGAGDPTVTGYSSYGSRGQFELTTSFIPCGSLCNVTQDLTTAAPSPSPMPLPSPSPSPAPKALRVTSILLSKSYTSAARTAYFCSVTVTVRNSTLVAMSGVRVNGVFSSQPVITGFDSNTGYGLTSTSGTVAFRSNSITSALGNSCIFTVSDAVLVGYVLDASTSLMSRQISW